jgi:hypothetical protein
MDLLTCSKNLPFSVESLESQLPVGDLGSLSSPAQSPSYAADLASPATPPEKLRDRVALSSGPWSKSLLSLVAKGKRPADISEPKARRSLRQKQLHKGFKSSPCSNKNCLGCSMDPPTLSPPVIRNLGATFCKIDPSKLSVEELSKVNKPSAPGGKRQSKKFSKNGHDNDGHQTSKKKPKK